MKTLFLTWQYDTTPLMLTSAICIFYLYMLHFKPVKQSVYFFSGVLIMVVSAASPLHFLGLHYMFSGHMVTHVLLLLVAAPLMVLGIPENNRFQHSLKMISGIFQKWAVLCWFTGIGIMWFWHIPSVYRHLMQMHTMQGIHLTLNSWNYVHVFSLWLAGIVFSWVVVGPYPQYRISPLTGILYLTTACMGCSLLGLLITFAPDGLYAMAPVTHTGHDLEKAAPGKWNIAHTTDQQIAGLIMWVPCCFIYLAGVLFLIKQWLEEKDENMAPDISH